MAIKEYLIEINHKKEEQSMSKCNLALNANINMKEQPNQLYVHGSVMVYSMNDQVVIRRNNPQGINGRVLLLTAEVINNPGPMKGMPRAFLYSEEVQGQQYDQVTVIYDGGQSCTVDIESFG